MKCCFEICSLPENRVFPFFADSAKYLKYLPVHSQLKIIMTPLEIGLLVTTSVFLTLFVVFAALYGEVLETVHECGDSKLLISLSKYSAAADVMSATNIQRIVSLKGLRCQLRKISFGDAYVSQLPLANASFWVGSPKSVQFVQIDQNYNVSSVSPPLGASAPYLYLDLAIPIQ
jgi:hypothetical protein